MKARILLALSLPFLACGSSFRGKCVGDPSSSSNTMGKCVDGKCVDWELDPFDVGGVSSCFLALLAPYK